MDYVPVPPNAYESAACGIVAIAMGSSSHPATIRLRERWSTSDFLALCFLVFLDLSSVEKMFVPVADV